MAQAKVVLVIAALLSGCAGQVERPTPTEEPPGAEPHGRGTREPPEGEQGDPGAGPDHAVMAPVGLPAPSPEVAEVRQGTLSSSGGCPANKWELCESGPKARSSICVSIDESGEVIAIDELPCSTFWAMHDGSTEPWLACGGCILTLDRTLELPGSSVDPTGPWLLSGRGMGCDEFDGFYYVNPSPVCGQ